MFSQEEDRWFAKALRALPTSLRDAIVDAELDDSVLLRSFRPYGVEKLGLCAGGRRGHILFDTDHATVAKGTADSARQLNIVYNGATEVDCTAGGLANLDDSAAAVGLASEAAKKRRSKKYPRKGPVPIEAKVHSASQVVTSDHPFSFRRFQLTLVDQ